MSRIRTIKPDFWKHERLSELPEATHMLAAALLNYSDDDGYFNANPRLIQGECFPLRELSVSIPESLRTLSDDGYLRLGTGADGKRYGHIIHFSDHQKISHPTDSKIKKMEIVWEDSRKPPGAVPEASSLKGREREEEQGKESRSLRSRDARENDLASIDTEFETIFWPAYPNKVGKPDAMMAYRHARQGQRVRGKPPREPMTCVAIMAGVDRYVLAKPEDRQWLNPTSFLNAEHYNDEPASPPVGNGKSRPHDTIFGALAKVAVQGPGMGERQADPDVGNRGNAGPAPKIAGPHPDLEIPAFMRRG